MFGPLAMCPEAIWDFFNCLRSIDQRESSKFRSQDDTNSDLTKHVKSIVLLNALLIWSIMLLCVMQPAEPVAVLLYYIYSVQHVCVLWCSLFNMLLSVASAVSVAALIILIFFQKIFYLLFIPGIAFG